ncbi:hypothetical protein T12_12985 [Trichinella patagoniensis]|uniref:Uncharacterized protein n=1 Tax=Trichinella patagoniensis TaxID=990121 RepID=A0A0V0ZX89_9BILA|nr:hypothetical protein T12_12985 [Trichinella patagoniensis]
MKFRQIASVGSKACVGGRLRIVVERAQFHRSSGLLGKTFTFPVVAVVEMKIFTVHRPKSVSTKRDACSKIQIKKTTTPSSGGKFSRSNSIFSSVAQFKTLASSSRKCFDGKASSSSSSSSSFCTSARGMRRNLQRQCRPASASLNPACILSPVLEMLLLRIGH